MNEGQAIMMLLCLRFLKDANQSLVVLRQFSDQGSHLEFNSALESAGRLLRVEKPRNAASVQKAKEMVLWWLQLRPGTDCSVIPERGESPHYRCL